MKEELGILSSLDEYSPQYFILGHSVSDHWMDDYAKWRRWAYEQRYGRGRWDRDHGIEPDSKIPTGFVEYDSEIKKYWNSDSAIGNIEKEGKFIGILRLVAREVVEKERFVRRFGSSFEKDIQWHALSSLLDHLSRSPKFKAVLTTTSSVNIRYPPPSDRRYDRPRQSRRSPGLRIFVPTSVGLVSEGEI
jgi:hypothetical protein